MASNVDTKLLKQTKFPPEFNQKVDMKKVNIEISEILGNEDDVVIELCVNLLEGSQFPDIKKLQISLTGFLDKDTAKFCKDLWSLCLSAQASPQGVPKELLEAKKLELIQEKIDAEKAAEEAHRRREQEKARERELESIRQRERDDRRIRNDGRRGGGRDQEIQGLRFLDDEDPRIGLHTVVIPQGGGKPTHTFLREVVRHEMMTTGHATIAVYRLRGPSPDLGRDPLHLHGGGMMHVYEDDDPLLLADPPLPHPRGDGLHIIAQKVILGMGGVKVGIVVI
ncbi:MAG: hypothetical protein M1816_002109 [Peltula sp. TS41687]|nr:MAG: hypothetical protein M1816_002109 [Peltula sp. TS41687]